MQQAPYGHQYGAASPFTDQLGANRLGSQKASSNVESPASQGTVDQGRSIASGGVMVTNQSGSYKEKTGDCDSGPRSVRPQEENQQQQQSHDASSQARNAPEIAPTDGLLQNLESQGSATLCVIGKEITREIVSQSMEFFKTMKQLQIQAIVQPQLLGTFKQNLDRQERLQKSISMLFTRLGEVCCLIDGRYTQHVPSGVDARDLIPYADQPHNSIVSELSKNKDPSVLIALKEDHNEKRQALHELRTELEQIIQSIQDVSWNISSIMHNV